MGKRIHLFLLALAIGVIQGAAQVTTVRGIVTTEEDGEPVIGASVIVKGTALGTVTDVNGRFELSGLPPSATRLLISYISLMAKEVAIAPQVSVTLKSDTHLLDEVVVTALGISREKKALGYTAQEVKQNALVQGKDNNLLNSLSGFREIRHTASLVNLRSAIFRFVVHTNDFYRIFTFHLAQRPEAGKQMFFLIVSDE